LDDGFVAKGKDSRLTFSELLDQEHSRAVEPPRPAFDEVDDAGRGLVLVSESITPERAHQLVAAGAAVAWDDCGSRGRHGPVVWFSDPQLERMAVAGPPQLRRKKDHRDANLVEYRREDGRPVVIAEMSVRWADLMY
jgi:hypothetical protein